MANENHTMLQMIASRNFTVWARRWNKPRSSARKTMTQPMKPIQCHGVMATVASITQKAISEPGLPARPFMNDLRPGRGDVLHGCLRPGPDMRTLALVPEQDHCA